MLENNHACKLLHHAWLSAGKNENETTNNPGKGMKIYGDKPRFYNYSLLSIICPTSPFSKGRMRGIQSFSPFSVYGEGTGDKVFEYWSFELV